MTQRHMSDIVRHQRPVTLPPSATVKQACECMRDLGIGAIVVTQEGRPIGIFTGRDAVCRVLAHGRDAASTKLAEVMTAKPDAMAPGKTAVEALQLMQDGGYRHLLVMDKGKLVGVVSKGDFRGIELDRLDERTGMWERV
ncbi:MAG: CBS domain-containing protein [Proteobacteria bacterium]|nr:CBS domain-containing protein [Pseudomonadota bacterium]